MENFFGRKSKTHKSRQPSVSGLNLDESSIPYDKLAPSPRSPIPVGTVSQGLRNAPNISVISAPITNPTLTANGTELNVYAMQKSKADRDRAYAIANEFNNVRPGSPTTSVSTADSSTLYNDSTVTGRPKTPNSRKYRQSETSSSSDKRSPNMADFGQYPYPSSPNGVTHRSVPSPNPPSSVRPQSTARSESNRGSRHVPSLLSGDSHFPHLSQHFYHHSRQGNLDDFNFPRPDNDEDIEALFENVKRTRDLVDMPHLSIEQKWHMVYNDEHIRWKEDKTREDQARKQNETGQPALVVENTPEWYIKKFLDKTVTAKNASSLLVSLRSNEMRYVQRKLLVLTHRIDDRTVGFDIS